MPIQAPKVQIKINGKLISGWTEASITAGIERVPRVFNLATVVDVKDNIDTRFAPIQQPLEVFLLHPDGSQDRVVTGYFDAMADSLSENDHDIVFAGRGLCQDIIDCSAEFYLQKGKELLSLSVAEAIKKIAKPYNINVVVDAPLSKEPFIGVIAMNLGDSAYSAVEYLARVSGALLYENAKGDLVLGYPGSEMPSKSVITHQTAIRSRVELDTASLYSDYEIFSQAQAYGQDKYGTDPQGKFHDGTFDARTSFNGGARYRKLQRIADFLVNEEIYKTKNPQQLYANWLGQRLHGRSQIITVTVPGWTDSNKQLYRPNSTISVLLPYQNILRGTPKSPTPMNLLIVEAVYQISPQTGTTTTLTLMDKSAFGVEPTSPGSDADRRQLLKSLGPETGPGGLLGHI